MRLVLFYFLLCIYILYILLSELLAPNRIPFAAKLMRKVQLHYKFGSSYQDSEKKILCVQVQTGFGRTGDHFWGFEGHGVVPDIVTMAKGIGNG